MRPQDLQAGQQRVQQTESNDVAAGAQREKRKQILATTSQKIGPAVRECLSDYFASLGLSMQDGTGQERPALFQEEHGAREHTWRAWSRKKTGSHSDYRADGVHLLDEQTAYTITVLLVVDRNDVALLYIGKYIRSKFVGGTPVVASDFQMEIPAQLAGALETKTGIKVVGLAEYQDAQID
ncbi:MAG: hypothetical protein M1570_01495 [Chloroflexi bacterium]|nr:hypothetical protein [Chloroflexota bacterium]